MSKLVVTESIQLPDGDYQAKLAEIESKNGEYGDYFLFKFELLDAPEEVEFKTVSGQVTAKLTIGGKLYKWLVALNGGQPFTKGEEVDVNEFVGKKCKVIIENTPGGKNKDKMYAKVTNVMALRKSTTSEAASAQEKKTSVDEEFEEKSTGKTAAKPAPAATEDDDF